METSLHRQLKLHYAAAPELTEVTLDGFRIDAISPSGELIEIQHAGLGALRNKTKQLLARSKHKLRIVKPIIARKRVVTLHKPGGKVLRSRMSPKRSELLDLFQDLVHFSNVFPMKRLTLEFVLIEAEETRIDRKNPRRRGKQYVSLDQQLVTVGQSIEFITARDLLTLVPIERLPNPFDTAHLAAALERPRWFAQKVSYCLRQTGIAKVAGKRGNTQLYRLSPVRKARRAAA
ncbi:MAG: hypothetical protein KDA51_18015 [Planctomycetales bacterium]|nr:hypothetical protein [Planctomycetales bacterium]